MLFLHGWALGQHTYKRALKRLVHLGCRVYAPAMPGFGGTADLPGDQVSFAGYADWIAAFLDAVDVTEPVFVVGHSFGGGVAIKLAHDHPGRVRYLVLINSIGGTTWSAAGSLLRSVMSRPLWDLGFRLPINVLSLRHISRVVPVILEDALPNVIRNPLALWRVATLIRQADLVAELEELRHRQLPVVVLWGSQDNVVPRASFDALCAAIGSEGEVVPGRHSWLLADPDAFGEVLTNSIAVAQLARDLEATEGRENVPPANGLSRRGGRRSRSARRDPSAVPDLE